MPERGFLVQREARRVARAPSSIDAAAEAPYASGVLDVERKEMTMKVMRCISPRLGSALRKTGIR